MSKIQGKIVTILICLLNFPGLAQDADSLRQLLRTHINDTTRMWALSLLADITDAPEWERHNAELKKLAEQKWTESKPGDPLYKVYTRYYALSFHNVGVGHLNYSRLKEAEKAFLKSRKLWYSINDKKNAVFTGTELVKVYFSQRRVKEAIDLDYENLRYQEKHHDQFGAAESYVGLAAIYFNLNMLNKSAALFKKGYKYFLLVNDDEGALSSLNDLMTVYLQKEEYDSAMYYMKLAQQLDHSKVYPNTLATLKYKLGLIYGHQGKNEEAIAVFKEVLKNNGDFDDPVMLCHVYLGLSMCYEHLRNLPLAINYGEKAFGIANEYELPNEGEKITHWLHGVYKEVKNHQKALHYLELHTKFLKSKNAIEEATKLLEEQVKFDYEKRELKAQLKRNEQIARSKLKTEKAQFARNTWVMVSIGIFLVSIGVFYLYSNNRKFRLAMAEQRNQVLSQKLLVSQMNPHFIFNALNAIQNCVYKQDALKAGNYLSEFAILMRQILNSSTQNVISLQQELEIIKHYISLQRFRFNDRFDFEMNIDPEIKLSDTAIPPLLCQPFLENAIEHGFKDLNYTGLIRLSFEQKSNHLICKIEDNGCGLSETPQHKNHQSMAMKITDERIGLMNATELKGNIELVNLSTLNASQTGVIVTFTVPLKKLNK